MSTPIILGTGSVGCLSFAMAAIKMPITIMVDPIRAPVNPGLVEANQNLLLNEAKTVYALNTSFSCSSERYEEKSLRNEKQKPFYGFTKRGKRRK